MFMVAFPQSVFSTSYFLVFFYLSTPTSALNKRPQDTMSMIKDPSKPVDDTSITTTKDPSVQMAIYQTSNVSIIPSQKSNKRLGINDVKKQTHKILISKINRRASIEKPCLIFRHKKTKRRGKCLNMFCVVGFKLYQNQVGYILFTIQLFIISCF